MDDVMAGYKRVGVERPAKQKRSAGRGFRVNSRRFSVQRVRARRGLVVVDADQQQKHYCTSSHYSHNNKNSSCRLKSFGRSNSSFYSEAIADCLEFIKRSSSVSVDDHSPPVEQS
ncbi:hypothetical protein Scep_000034 [Stephania cephalantha]|uniref:Uncharacterized protein n=1 Tax=Stephania cephalantha TaxID=152367 RepID=A0AAP0Q2K3_9MAGN